MASDVRQEPVGSTDGPAEVSVGDLVRDATEQISTLIRGEVELARLELAASLRRLGWATAIFGAAVTLLLFSLFFPFIALAEGLVTVGLPRWGAYLVVWGVLMLLGLAGGLVGFRMVRRIRRPERTLRTVRDTARLALHPTRGVSGDGSGSSEQPS